MSEQDQTPAERVRDLLEHVNEALELDAEVEVVEEADRIRGVLHGDDMGLFIGRHGQTIDAVQHLAFKVAAHGQSPAPRVEVDAAGYRDRRRQALERQADQAAVRRRPRGSPRGVGRHERDRAQGRPRVPEGPRRCGDVLRGHRARPPPRRGAAQRLRARCGQAATRRQAFHVKRSWRPTVRERAPRGRARRVLSEPGRRRGEVSRANGPGSTSVSRETRAVPDPQEVPRGAPDPRRDGGRSDPRRVLAIDVDVRGPVRAP